MISKSKAYELSDTLVVARNAAINNSTKPHSVKNSIQSNIKFL